MERYLVLSLPLSLSLPLLYKFDGLSKILPGEVVSAYFIWSLFFHVVKWVLPPLDNNLGKLSL